MNLTLRFVLVFAACWPIAAQAAATQTVPPVAPRVFILDVAHLQATRQRIREGDTNFAPSLAGLEREAKGALTSGPFSVVTKEATPPSGDKHDFMSLAPYFWRNPATTNGLPYIRRDEAAAKNNHGTYYDLQVASFALFLGKMELASNVLQTARQKRIATQIEPDGRQPLELARTKAWGYSIMNLQGLMSLARLGEQAGVDVWNYRTADGRSISQALDFMTPFALGEQKWPYPQLGEWSPQNLFPLVRLAATKYPAKTYRTLAAKLPEPDPANRSRLLRPQIAGQKPAKERSAADKIIPE